MFLAHYDNMVVPWFIFISENRRPMMMTQRSSYIFSACWTDGVKDWTGLSIPECVQIAWDRRARRSFVSWSLVSDLQKWGWTKERLLPWSQSNCCIVCDS